MFQYWIIYIYFCALRFDIYKYLKWCWNLKHATHYQTLSNKFRNNWWCWAFGEWKCDEDNTKNTWYELLYQVHIHMQGGQDGNVVVVSLTRIISLYPFPLDENTDKNLLLLFCLISLLFVIVALFLFCRRITMVKLYNTCTDIISTHVTY